jgi:hypothetical protein
VINKRELYSDVLKDIKGLRPERQEYICGKRLLNEISAVKYAAIVPMMMVVKHEV